MAPLCYPYKIYDTSCINKVTPKPKIHTRKKLCVSLWSFVLCVCCALSRHATKHINNFEYLLPLNDKRNSNSNNNNIEILLAILQA